MRLGILIVASCVVAAGFVACSEEEVKREKEAYGVAESFYNAVLKGDEEGFIDLTDLPFIFQEKANTIETETALRAQFKKSRRAIKDRIRHCRNVEVTSYAELLDGESVAGKTFTPEKARAQAAKIGLHEGGLLVRVYHKDEETGREDGRNYFLVLHADSIGDLKITAYQD